jgi:hypothetical protein
MKETRGYWKFKEKHYIILCAELAFEVDMNLLYNTRECMTIHALHPLNMVNPIRFITH